MGESFVHPTAIVDAGCELGAGTKVWAFAHILHGSRLGARCIVGQNCMIGPDVVIGNGVKLQNNVSVYTGVTLEDDVFCGPSMVFTNVLTPRSHVSRKHLFAPTLVQRGATIGANATVICGHTIGEYAMIGAGAVVTKDVPAHAIVVGNPARMAGWACQCGEKLHFDYNDRAQCASCGSQYVKAPDGQSIADAPK